MNRLFTRILHWLLPRKKGLRVLGDVDKEIYDEVLRLIKIHHIDITKVKAPDGFEPEYILRGDKVVLK